MVGRLNPAAISAVGVSRQFVMFMFFGVMSVSTGATTLVAHFTGSGDKIRRDKTAQQAISLGLISAGILGGIGVLLTGPFLRFMGVEPEVVAYATPYMKIFFSGVFMVFTNFIIGACMRGTGDTKTPLYIMSVVNAINVLGNYLLIFGKGFLPRLEVAGAGLGTIIARSVGVLMGLTILGSGRHHLKLRGVKEFIPEKDLAKRMLKIGVPHALQGISRSSARLAFLKILAFLPNSTIPIAAFTIGLQVEMLTIMPALAFQIATVALVGRNLGAGDPDEAERTAWGAARLGFYIMSSVAVLIFLFAEKIVGIFTPDQQVIEVGKVYLWFAAFSQPLDTTAIIISGALMGAGDTKSTLAYTVISQWLLRIPAAYVLVSVVELGPVGAWIAMAVSSAAHTAMVALRLRSGRWKSIDV
jgi:putative MATE family efflux protein